ncbi:MAG: TetR family transcriptional regulator [Acidobacteria bacterium]|nr:TetR family transcriptional regulator [Acidobacteriota bacterium]
MILDTSERILNAAEVLFAERGFDAVSVREITGQAQTNLASVNYHFGSKNELLDAVLHRRLGPINQRRMQQLDLLLATQAKPELSEVLRAFLDPPFQTIQEMGTEDATFLRLLARIHLESNTTFTARLKAQFNAVLSAFLPVLQSLLPDLTPEVLQQRLFFAIGSMSHAVAFALNRQTLGVAANPTAILDQLIAFTTAGLSAGVKS